MHARMIVLVHARARKRCAFAHTRMQACKHACTYKHTHTHTHTHTCTHMHTHAHTHARAQTQTRARTRANARKCTGYQSQAHGGGRGTYRLSITKSTLPRLVGRSSSKSWSCRGSSSSMALLRSLMICKRLAASEGSGIGSTLALTGVCQREGSPTSVAGPDRARRPARAAPLSCRQHPTAAEQGVRRNRSLALTWGGWSERELDRLIQIPSSSFKIQYQSQTNKVTDRRGREHVRKL